MQRRFFALTVCLLGLAAWPARAHAGALEAGFQPLFPDASLAGWVKMGAAGFSLGDAGLYCDGTGNYPTWLRSQEVFENFVLRFQVKLPADGDGGVLLHAPLHGDYASVGLLIKLADDTPRERPTFTSTGGVFGAQPPRRLLGRPGRWLDVEIDCNYPRLKVIVDGQVAQDLDVRDDPRLRYRPRRGFLGFQDCGKVASYRKLRIKRLPSTEKEWLPLTRGDDFAGWKPPAGDARWSIHAGVVLAEDGNGYLITEREYHDFELATYVQTGPRSNGGIFCRFKSLVPHDRGFEIQIEDIPESSNPTGSIYNFRRACCTPVRPGSWYPLYILVRGRHATVCVNGVTAAQTDQLPVDRPGHIAIQMHHRGSWLRLKELKVKPLD